MLARCMVNAPSYRADVLIRLLHSDTAAETPDRIVVMRRPAWVFALQIGRQPQIDVCWEAESGREHADNGEDRAIDLQVRLGEVPRRSEILPPISTADKNGGPAPFFASLALKSRPRIG